MAIVIGPDEGQGQPVRGDENVGNVSLWLFCRDHRSGTFFQRHGNESVPVGLEAGNGHKQASRRNLPGIVGHACNVQVLRCGGLQNLHATQ